MHMKSATTLLLLLALMVTLPSGQALSATVPTAKPDKGLVVFYREKKVKGKAMRFQITDSSGVSVGALSSGSMFYQYYDPGQKTFDVRSPSVDGSDLITLDIVAGETYFVRGEILWGWPTGRPKFSRPSESQALSDIGKLKF